jgi:hypothetical protein
MISMRYDLANLPIQSLLKVSGADSVAVPENRPASGCLLAGLLAW